MKNNTIGTVAVSNSKRPRARFNLSSDVHTSMDFGSVVPGTVRMMIPNSKQVVSSRTRILCSPMIAPTMGRLSFKAYHNFVRMSDLTKNFVPMLSQESVSRGASQFVPQSVPTISIGHLSAFVLFGSTLNIYKRNSTGTADDADASACLSSIYSGTTGDITTDADLSALGILNKYAYPSLNIASCFCFKSDFIFGNSGNNHVIALGNPNNATFYPIDPACDYYEANKDWYDLSPVTPQNADLVYPTTLANGDTFYLCFRLSDYGKRLRKIFIGCGYQIDLTSSQVVSLLPLFAFYKSYFDVFGLTLYNNWEQSFASRFLTTCDLSATNDFTTFWSNAWNINGNNSSAFLLKFICNELATTFYTDEQDFVSSHTRNNAVSPAPTDFISSINTDVDPNRSYAPNLAAGNTAPNEPLNLSNPNGHAVINDVLHGQLDSELLKRLYRWTNRNTIAGRRIAELLRAQGLGSYVDECKSDFIGSFELPIDIFDGTSSSDTYSAVSDSGAPLGERFGVGQASSGDERNKHCEDSFTFECNEFGYWVTLISVVPKGGYAESVDPTVLATSKFQFYNPDFDSLGMEFDPKNLVVGSMPFSDITAASGKLEDSFGLVPRYFRWKFGRNVANGDFTRRGVRASFAGYYLDKVIDVGDRLVRPITSVGPSVSAWSLVKAFKPSMLPIAGDVWRYPTRYPFIGKFNRIFNRIAGSRDYSSMMSVDSQAEFELFSTSDDNFVVHMISDVQYFAPMLPVEESFETYDDDNAANSSMSKA